MKTKNKYPILILIFIVVFLLIALFIKNKIYHESESNSYNEIFNWDDYQSCFEYIVDNYQVDGLTVKASTKGGNVTAVDVYDSLNNRPYLTLDGKFDPDNLTPTEEQLIIEDINQSIQITITLVYTSNYIGYDILAYPSNVGFGTLNENLVKKSTNLIGSYNNLVFSVNQCSLDEYDIDLMDKSVKELINLLQEYFNNNN
jgi:hypothetical protein